MMVSPRDDKMKNWETDAILLHLVNPFKHQFVLLVRCLPPTTREIQRGRCRNRQNENQMQLHLDACEFSACRDHDQRSA